MHLVLERMKILTCTKHKIWYISYRIFAGVNQRKEVNFLLIQNIQASLFIEMIDILWPVQKKNCKGFRYLDSTVFPKDPFTDIKHNET